MKTALIILALATVAMQSPVAQTRTSAFPKIGAGATREQNIPVLAGEVVELHAWAPVRSSPEAADFFFCRWRTVSLPTDTNGGIYALALLSPQIRSIAGPKTVSTVPTQTVASQAAVIPENGNANADVSLDRARI